MKNLKILCIVFTIFQVIIINNTKAQDVLDKIPPSPDIAALGKFIDVPVSYYTGIPEITIPIHTLTEGSLSLPISLDYHAGGIKVNEVASRVGLGWALNAGGFVARTVQGLPDESTNGFFNGGEGIDLSCGNDDIDAIGNGLIDGEPDIFSFMIPGYSGKFYINAKLEVVQIVHSDLKIETNLTDNDENNGFRITTPQGTAYYFGNFFGSGPHIGIESYSTSPFTHTSWLLTKIESYNKTESIELDYDEEFLSFKSKKNWNCLENGSPHFDINYSARKLKSIKTEYESVFFNYEEREDLLKDNLNNPSRLASIKIQNGVGINFCKEYKLSQNYFSSGDGVDEKRLRLDGLQEISCDGNDVIPPYTFEYFEDKPLPHRLSTAMDHWGFFNGIGADNAGALIPGEVSMNHTISGSNFLPLVTLPPDIFLGLNICNITPIFQGALPTVISNLLPDFIDLGLSPGTAGFTYMPPVAPTDPRASDSNFMHLGTLEKITYPHGGKHQFEYEANDATGNTTVGGLRIQKITLSPKVNAKDAIVKNYSYTTDDGVTSSGVLYHMPVYDVVWGEILLPPKPSCNGNDYKSLDNQLVIPLRMRVAENITQLSDFEGIHIGYGRVTETISGETRVLEFDTEAIAGDTPFNKGDSFSDFDSFTGGEIPFPPAPAQARVNAGTLLKETISNVDGTVVSEIEYIIKEDEYIKSNEAYAKVFELKGLEISINDILSDLKLDPITSVLPSNFTTISLADQLVNSYKIRSKPYRISSRSATLDGVTQLTKYAYEHEGFVNNVTMIEKGIDVDKNGTFDNTTEVLKTEFNYIWEIQSEPEIKLGIALKHMVGVVGETKTTINNNLVSGSRTDYIASDGMILPENIWVIQGDDFVLKQKNYEWNIRGYPTKYKRAKSGAEASDKLTDAGAFDQNYFFITYDKDDDFPNDYQYLQTSTGQYKADDECETNPSTCRTLKTTLR